MKGSILPVSVNTSSPTIALQGQLCWDFCSLFAWLLLALVALLGTVAELPGCTVSVLRTCRQFPRCSLTRSGTYF